MLKSSKLKSVRSVYFFKRDLARLRESCYKKKLFSNIHALTLSTLGKIFSRQHIKVSIFLIFHDFYISCKLSPDNLHKMTKPVFFGKKKRKNITNLLSAELVQRVVKFRYC